MTSADQGGKGKLESARHVYGPRALGAVLPAVTRPSFRRRAPATAQVLADWPLIVGPALAAVTLPRRLSADTLTIACAGPVAMELQHLATSLIDRINAHLGRVTVTRLRFVQEAFAPPPPLLPPTPPRPGAVVAARAAVAGIAAGELHDALERLGQAVLTDPPA